MVGSTRRRLAGHAAIYGLSSVFPVVTAVAITPWVTRRLGSLEYGVVATALVVVQVTALLLPLGLPAAITRHAVIERSGARGAAVLVVAAAPIALATGLLVALTALWWSPHLLEGRGPALAAVAITAGGALAVVTCYQSLARGEERPWAFAACTAAMSLGGQATGLGVAFVMGGTARAYLVGLAAGYLAVCLVLLLDAARRSRRPDGQSRSRLGDLREALRIGLPTVPHSLALLLTTGACVALAATLFGARQAGQIQLIMLLGGAPTLALTAVNNVWAPAVYRAAPGSRGRLIGLSLTWVVAGAGVLSAAVILGAPLALRVLAPEHMMEDAPRWAVGLAVVSVLPAAIYLGNVHILFAEGRTAALAVTTPVNLAVTLAACGLLSRAWGVGVLAAVPTIFYAMQALTVRWLRLRASAERWPETKTTIMALVLGCAVVVTAATPDGGAWVLLRACAGVLLVLAASAWLARHRGVLGSVRP